MFVYRPHFLPTSIILIGAGGTGSRLLPPLAQLVKTCLRKHTPGAILERCDIYVVDGDIVEEKNLTRQHFIAQDVGKNKALVVAERYSRAFGMNIIPCPHFLKQGMAPTFDGPIGPVKYADIFQNAIVIFAVDSAKARRDILSLMNSYCVPNLFVVDAGNEDDFGQIKTFTGHYLSNEVGNLSKTLLGLPSNIPSEIDVGFIPFDFNYYRNLGESAQERSCADLPQTLAINTMMSTLILCTIQNFMQMRPMKYDGQNFSLSGGVSTSWNTHGSWARRVEDGYLDSRQVREFLSRRAGVKIHAGTALEAVGVADGDIFYRLRQKALVDYRDAGMILKPDGTLISSAPPPPPPAPKLIEKKISVADELAALQRIASAYVDALPPAPTLIRVPTVTIQPDLMGMTEDNDDFPEEVAEGEMAELVEAVLAVDMPTPRI